MTEVPIAITALVTNTRSADLIASGTDTNNGDTFTIAALNQTKDTVVVLEEQDGAAATITFNAGDNPPSLRAPLGSLTITLAANDVRVVTLEGGRFIQSDGTITGSITGGIKVTVLRGDRGW